MNTEGGNEREAISHIGLAKTIKTLFDLLSELLKSVFHLTRRICCVSLIWLAPIVHPGSDDGLSKQLIRELVVVVRLLARGG